MKEGNAMLNNVDINKIMEVLIAELEDQNGVSIEYELVEKAA